MAEAFRLVIEHNREMGKEMMKKNKEKQPRKLMMIPKMSLSSESQNFSDTMDLVLYSFIHQIRICHTFIMRLAIKSGWLVIAVDLQEAENFHENNLLIRGFLAWTEATIYKEIFKYLRPEIIES